MDTKPLKGLYYRINIQGRGSGEWGQGAGERIKIATFRSISSNEPLIAIKPTVSVNRNRRFKSDDIMLNLGFPIQKALNLS